MEPRPTPPPGPGPEPTTPGERPEPIAPFEQQRAAAPGAKPDHVKRFLAKLVDGLIAAVLFWIAVIIIPGWFAASFIGAILAAGYWIVCDGLDVDFMKQRSLGKKLIGLNVVRLDGQPMDIESSARRNWMFALGWFYYPAGWILSLLISLALLVIFIYEVYKVFTEPDAHRWGDELAGTRVIPA